MSKLMKVGLALGSGSARGFAHIGVIRALEAEGIPIDCVAGTSIGAIVGAVYAAGVLSKGEKFLNDFDWKDIRFLLDPLFPISGLLGGKRIEKLFGSFFDDRHIEDFPLPFAAVATDVTTGEEVVFRRGNAVKALRASMSLPGIFAPILFENRLLVDGGLVSPVPVKATRMLGADVVIAVNLAADMSRRSYIAIAKPAPEALQTQEAFQKAEILDQESINAAGPEIPQFLRETIERGQSFVEEQTQALEQWVDEKVAKGRAVLTEKGSFLGEWFAKEGDPRGFPDIFSVLFNSINIMQDQIARSSLHQHPPDVLLSPDLAKIRLLDFDKVEECIQEGERVTRLSLPQIKQALENHD
jgi:NTE family protein